MRALNRGPPCLKSALGDGRLCVAAVGSPPLRRAFPHLWARSEFGSAQRCLHRASILDRPCHAEHPGSTDSCLGEKNNVRR
jgi:hypothetical protein